jgi:hypothetical protein
MDPFEFKWAYIAQVDDSHYGPFPTVMEAKRWVQGHFENVEALYICLFDPHKLNNDPDWHPHRVDRGSGAAL